MKNTLKHLMPVLLTVAMTAPVQGVEKDVVIRRAGRPGGEWLVASKDDSKVIVRRGEGRMEKEKVAYLGVQTSPVGRALASQLGLPRDTGLVVTDVVEDSPAAAVLQRHDILTKLDDQILIDQHQLGVLIRNKKAGDDVTLTIYRGGKESRVKATLGEHEVPRFSLMEAPAPGFGGLHGFALESPAFTELHRLPGMEPGQVGDVIRMIGRNRGRMFGTPGVHVIRRGDKGATILDLPRGNIVYSDDEGSIEVQADEDRRELTVKDAAGKVLFKGPVNSPEEREKLPQEIKERLSRVERAEFSFEIDEEFRAGGADVRPEAGLRRIDLLPAPDVARAHRDARTF